MESFLLSVHVLAGILFIGPVAVSTSLFPRYAPVSTPGAGTSGGIRHASVAVLLARITSVYGTLAVAVPIVGLILAAAQGRLGEVWIVTAMVLTALAGGLLLLRIAPAQRAALAAPDDGRQLRRLAMTAGIFNLIWAVVVVLMIVRPGYAS